MKKKTEHICNTFDPDNVEPEMWNKMAAQIEKKTILTSLLRSR